MKKVFIFLAVFFAASSAQAGEWKGLTLPEEAHYAITYFGVKAGSASIRIEEADYRGRPAVKITARVWSSKLFSVFYRVNDTIVSILDAETLRPFEHSVDYEEGSYRRKTQYLFDYEKGECRSGEGAVSVTPEVLDPAGALFFIRLKDLEKEKSFFHNVCDGRKMQQVSAEVTGLKRIATLWGWKDAFIVKPQLKDIRREGATAVRQDVTIYYLKDMDKVPYLVTGKLVIGSLVIRMTSLKNK